MSKENPIVKARITIVELLIVVMVLGILAAAVIPQFTGATDNARLSSLDANLAEMRGAVELYYHHHNRCYPGQMRSDAILPVSSPFDASAAFVAQLTQYTDANGIVSASKTARFAYGPYLKQIPSNPFNDLATVRCNIFSTDVATAQSDGMTGWMFYTQTGNLIANDGAHDNR